MANMDYCRFQNTARDLQDCREHLLDENLSETEERNRKKLIKICQEIAYEVDSEDDDE